MKPGDVNVAEEDRVYELTKAVYILTGKVEEETRDNQVWREDAICQIKTLTHDVKDLKQDVGKLVGSQDEKNRFSERKVKCIAGMFGFLGALVTIVANVILNILKGKGVL